MKLYFNQTPTDHAVATAKNFTPIDFYQTVSPHSADVDKLRRILETLTSVLKSDEIFSFIYLILLFGETEASMKKMCTKMAVKKLNEIFKCSRGAEVLDFIKVKIQDWIRTVPFMDQMKEPDLGLQAQSDNHDITNTI